MFQTYHQADAEKSEGGSLLRFGLKSIFTLTVVAMAALGLQTDIRAVARAGGRVVAAVILSLSALVLLALALIRLLGL